jgi:hypothetical protein
VAGQSWKRENEARVGAPARFGATCSESRRAPDVLSTPFGTAVQMIVLLVPVAVSYPVANAWQ